MPPTTPGQDRARVLQLEQDAVEAEHAAGCRRRWDRRAAPSSRWRNAGLDAVDRQRRARASRAARRAAPPACGRPTCASSSASVAAMKSTTSQLDRLASRSPTPPRAPPAPPTSRCARAARATVRANAAASLVALRASVESIGPCRLIGVAAPMLVPGAIAATSAAMVTNTPAEAACAPARRHPRDHRHRGREQALAPCRACWSRGRPGVSSSTTSAAVALALGALDRARRAPRP